MTLNRLLNPFQVWLYSNQFHGLNDIPEYYRSRGVHAVQISYLVSHPPYREQFDHMKKSVFTFHTPGKLYSLAKLRIRERGRKQARPSLFPDRIALYQGNPHAAGNHRPWNAHVEFRTVFPISRRMSDDGTQPDNLLRALTKTFQEYDITTFVVTTESVRLGIVECDMSGATRDLSDKISYRP